MFEEFKQRAGQKVNGNSTKANQKGRKKHLMWHFPTVRMCQMCMSFDTECSHAVHVTASRIRMVIATSADRMNVLIKLESFAAV